MKADWIATHYTFNSIQLNRSSRSILLMTIKVPFQNDPFNCSFIEFECVRIRLNVEKKPANKSKRRRDWREFDSWQTAKLGEFCVHKIPILQDATELPTIMINSFHSNRSFSPSIALCRNCNKSNEKFFKHQCFNGMLPFNCKNWTDCQRKKLQIVKNKKKLSIWNLKCLPFYSKLFEIWTKKAKEISKLDQVPNKNTL